MSIPATRAAFPRSSGRCSATGARDVRQDGQRIRRRQPRRHHGVCDHRHADAGARHDHRQCGVALYAGQRVRQPGSDRLGADLLHRRRRHYDAADRLSGRPVRIEESLSRIDHRLHGRFDAVRHGAVGHADRSVSRVAGCLRSGAGPTIANGAAQHLSARAPGLCQALFGMGVMVGPVLGPVLGGWLTENYSWRWVFYINLPIGIVALLGMIAFLPETPRNSGEKLDWFGFGTLSLAIGALQIMLDLGEQKDWFSSGEIMIEAIVAVSAFYLFLVHTFTAERPFVRPSLFRDRNFAAGVLFVSVIGLTYYASMALQPPYLQTLMGYPVVTAGVVMGPRGVGTMASMLIVGRLTGRVDTRLLLAIGLALTAWSFNEMTGWTPDVSQATIIGVGVVQGAGLGFLFVPLSAATLSTLPLQTRTEGAGLYNLSRNIGSSVGISIVNSLITRNTQANHAAIVPSVTAVNRGFEHPAIAHAWDPLTAAGRAALDAVITKQAQIIAYIDDYKFLMIATLAVLPLLIVFRKPAG